MTTIHTRLYSNQRIARSVQDRLYREGFPRHVMRVFNANSGEDVSAIEQRISAACVPAREAAVYAENVARGATLLVVEANYKPLGAVIIGREVLEGTDSIPCNIECEEFKVATRPDHAPYVLKDHPRFFTTSPDQDLVGGPLSDQLGILMLAAKRRFNSAIEGGGLMFPFSALTHRKKAKSAIKGGYFFSRSFWPMKLVTTKRRRKSIISGGGHPFSRLFGWSTVSR